MQSQQCIAMEVKDTPKDEAALISSSSTINRKKRNAKWKQNRAECWNENAIKVRIGELEEELRKSKAASENGKTMLESGESMLSISRVKRIKERLRQLQKGLAGEKVIGGQLKKKESTKKKFTSSRDRGVSTYSRMASRDPENAVKKIHKSIKCLRCRRGGHLLIDCPLNIDWTTHSRESDAAAKQNSIKKACGFCFNCGKTNHALRDCKQPRSEDGHLPFATCFVCNLKGHLAVNCPKNENGMFPKGGGCRICGSVYHKQSSCPEKQNDSRRNRNEKSKRAKSDGPEDSDEYWLDQVNSSAVATQTKKRRKKM